MLKVASIPAFNVEEKIADVIKRALNYVDIVVVCDDGSSDQTAEISKEEGATVIKHQKNLGKGAALQSLFKYAREINADIMVTIDGDGQFLPEEMDKLIAPIEKDQYDVVIGYRFDNSKEMPKYRMVGNKMLDRVTKIASDLPFRDTQSGFRAYSKKAIETINFVSNGFGSDSEILIDAFKKGLKITEKKITVLYNTGSKTSTKNPVSHTTEVLASLIELIALKHPLKYLGLPGLGFLIVGAVSSVMVLSYFNESRYFSIPLTLVAFGALLIGLMLLLMSVVLFSIVRTSRRSL
ncbi:MAG: glycosyltransferase family 2 protein [Nitrosotalea sp.]